MTYDRELLQEILLELQEILWELREIKKLLTPQEIIPQTEMKLTEEQVAELTGRLEQTLTRQAQTRGCREWRTAARSWLSRLNGQSPKPEPRLSLR